MPGQGIAGIASFCLIQTSATVGDGFGPEHEGRASGLASFMKQRIANGGMLRMKVDPIKPRMSQGQI